MLHQAAHAACNNTPGRRVICKPQPILSTTLPSPPTHLHGRLNVHSAHQAVLRHAQRDLHKRRVPHPRLHLPAAQLLSQSILQGQGVEPGVVRACARLMLAMAEHKAGVDAWQARCSMLRQTENARSPLNQGCSTGVCVRPAGLPPLTSHSAGFSGSALQMEPSTTSMGGISACTPAGGGTACSCEQAGCCSLSTAGQPRAAARASNALTAPSLRRSHDRHC